jgi:hypothetical protein
MDERSAAPESANPRKVRIAVALTCVLFFLIILGIGMSSIIRWADFAGPYTGAVILGSGHGSKLYDIAEQERVQQQLPGRKGLFLPYLYPPFQALLFSPLTRLGYRAPYIIWGGINIALWFLFLRFFQRQAKLPIEPFAYLKLCALFFPVSLTLIQGQFSILLLVSLALAYSYVKDERDFAAGLALGLGLLKFQIVLPLALVFTLRGKWKVLAGVATAASILALLSLYAVGPSGLLSYVDLLAHVAGHPSGTVYSTITPWNMPSVRGLIAGLMRGRISDRWIAVIWVCMAASLLGYTAWCWERAERSHDTARTELMFGAAVAVAVLAAPHLNPHDLAPMLLAILLVVGSRWWKTRCRERSVLLVAISVLYAMPVYYPLLVGFHALYLMAPVLIAFVWATISLVRKDLPGGSGAGKGESTPYLGHQEIGVATGRIP